MNEEETTGKQRTIKGKEKSLANLLPYQFKKGQSGNPSGRPAGKSLKEYAKEMLASMSEDERQNFLHGIAKETIWKLAEGNPENKTDLTTKGEKLDLSAKTLEIAKKYEAELKESL